MSAIIRILLPIMPYIFLLIGISGVGMEIYYKRRQKAIKDWPSTLGMITKSEVFENEVPDGMSQKIQFVSIVTYSYKIGGEGFTNSKIDARDDYSFDTKEKAMDILTRFPLAEQVQVFYNPEKPADSVLDKVSKKSNILIGFITALLIGIIWLGINLAQ